MEHSNDSTGRKPGKHVVTRPFVLPDGFETLREWHIWLAGFFDGEGSIALVPNRTPGGSDYHKMVIKLTQRIERAERLYVAKAEFGGGFVLADTETRGGEKWGIALVWQLQAKPGQRQFIEAMRPFCDCKSVQLEIATRFLDSFGEPTRLRDDLGRVRGMALTREIIEHRNALCIEMHAANELGPRLKPFQPTASQLVINHLAPPTEPLIGNRATVTRGETHATSKLTDAIVLWMRETYADGGISMQALADRHSVTRLAVRKLLFGLTWAHVGGPILSGSQHWRRGNY